MARDNWYKPGTDGDSNGADYDGALKRIDQEQQDGDPTSDYLRYTTAKDLVDANVASFVANETAKKNVQNQLGSMGLGNNGYAATVGAMMGNQLNSSLASNQRAYDEAIRGIELDEAQKADQLTAERANAIVNNMSLLSGSALQEYMKEQGFTWNEDTQTWSNPDYPDAIVNDINTNYKISNGLYGAKPITSINDINVEGYNSTNIQNEYDYLMTYYRQNPPTEGYVVEMKNGEGKGVAYVQYRGGNWYQVSKDVFDRVGDGNRRTLYKMSRGTTVSGGGKTYRIYDGVPYEVE